MNPIIIVIVGMMVSDPISLDVLDYFFSAFLHLTKYYKIELFKLIDQFLAHNNVGVTISYK
ncbi:hypothetical protein MXB_5449, partial [Myxobolus squamalis]